jgi:hypothetical protein
MVVIMPGDRLTFGEVNAELMDFGVAPKQLEPDAAKALSSPPSVREPGDDWAPEDGFAGLSRVKVNATVTAGVFFSASHPSLGEVDVFAYYPGLCANSAFRRLARYEAESRFISSVPSVPRLLEIGSEVGILHLVYEKAPGTSIAKAVEQGRLSRLEATFKVLKNGVEVISKVSASGRSHGAISPATVMIKPDGELMFSLLGVMIPERIERLEQSEPVLCDMRDLCSTAYFCLCGAEISEKLLDHEALRTSEVSPVARNPRAPEALSKVLLKGLALTGKVRYGALAELARDLEDLASGNDARVIERITREESGT